MYLTLANMLFLSFFAYNEINKLSYVLSVRLRIPTPSTSIPLGSNQASHLSRRVRGMVFVP